MDIGLQESRASDGFSATREAELTREAAGCEEQEGQEGPPHTGQHLEQRPDARPRSPRAVSAAGGKGRVCGGLEAEKGAGKGVVNRVRSDEDMFLWE